MKQLYPVYKKQTKTPKLSFSQNYQPKLDINLIDEELKESSSSNSLSSDSEDDEGKREVSVVVDECSSDCEAFIVSRDTPINKSLP